MTPAPTPWQAVTQQPDQLGESPFWHPHEQLLYWVDIPARQIRRANVFMGTGDSWAVPQEPGCIAPATGGGLVEALRDGVYRASEWGGALQPIARFSHDVKTTRFNDGKADPLGRFWAGTMYEPRDARRAELYSVDCRPGNGAGGKPVIQLKAQNGVIANGLAWSPDATTVYWSDTTHHVIQSWDWDATSNAMSRHCVFHQFAPKPAGWQLGMDGYGGRPDGAAVDVQGNYWVAMFEGARVLKLSHAGDILTNYPVPAHCPTMPCFGGADLKTLYITTARDKRPPDELAAQPLAGCVLQCRVDVAGLPAHMARL